MRFSFRKKPAPRWVDSANLAWTPEEPLAFEASDGDARVFTPPPPEPEAPQPAPVEEPQAFEPGFSSDEAFRAFIETDPFGPRAHTPPPQAPAPPPPAPAQAANSNRAPRLLLIRLGVGLAQGLGLYLLLHLRAAGMWPGSDPYLFAALAMAGIFAPLVLLEGLGEIPLPLLALWTGIVAALLFSLGLYHHWRIQGPEQAYAGLPLAVLTALMLVAAQALLRAGVHDGKILPGYRTCFDTSWSLIARLMLWGLVTATAWLLLDNGLLTRLRLPVEPALITAPLIAMLGATSFALTGAGSSLRRFAKRALLACCTLALPLLVIASAATVLLRSQAPVSTALCLLLAALLVLAVNASYRGDAQRGRWRKVSEGAAAFLIFALVVIAAFALGARVMALGWTASRIYAASAVMVLGLYGVFYAGAALRALGGGRWMQRIEPANRIMALVLVVTCLALASPLADPLKLAVASQAARLQSGAVAPAGFDFDYLRQHGVRFGQQALIEMAQHGDPDLARDAATALATAPDGHAPTPSEIAANITLHTPDAGLPPSLLGQDWTKAGAATPCLTVPARSCDAWMADLDGDGTGEVLLVHSTETRWWAAVLKAQGAGWKLAARFVSPSCQGTHEALRSGRYTLADPLPGWRDVLETGLGKKPAFTAELPCPALASTKPS